MLTPVIRETLWIQRQILERACSSNRGLLSDETNMQIIVPSSATLRIVTVNLLWEILANWNCNGLFTICSLICNISLLSKPSRLHLLYSQLYCGHQILSFLCQRVSFFLGQIPGLQCIQLLSHGCYKPVASLMSCQLCLIDWVKLVICK